MSTFEDVSFYSYYKKNHLSIFTRTCVCEQRTNNSNDYKESIHPLLFMPYLGMNMHHFVREVNRDRRHGFRRINFSDYVSKNSVERKYCFWLNNNEIGQTETHLLKSTRGPQVWLSWPWLWLGPQRPTCFCCPRPVCVLQPTTAFYIPPSERWWRSAASDASYWSALPCRCSAASGFPQSVVYRKQSV